MDFGESVLARLRRYREEADRSLEIQRTVGDATRRFSERLFGGLECSAALGRRAGFGVEVERARDALVLRVEAASGVETRLTFGLVRGAAAETDEYLMHEELSRYSLDPSGYSGRILGWSEEAGEEPCQTFAVYGDGLWKTKGLFVAKARGKVAEPGRCPQRLLPACTRAHNRPRCAYRRRGSPVVDSALYPSGTTIGGGASDGDVLAPLSSQPSNSLMGCTA
ncbi:MAG: hypothetical protein LC751_14130 [Actinobacteria bacterium]|nr:hypothetical protein [Actinomycetota bacterium]MCA1737304.1 hypothetical protein [Actinomycetota bacterium]